MVPVVVKWFNTDKSWPAAQRDGTSPPLCRLPHFTAPGAAATTLPRRIGGGEAARASPVLGPRRRHWRGFPPAPKSAPPAAAAAARTADLWSSPAAAAAAAPPAPSAARRRRRPPRLPMGTRYPTRKSDSKCQVSDRES